ncbi:plasmid stabilization protein [Alicycliphilus denitrificans]|uniref:plasmid stabilization protein n=1 Tax=Alicycliphilus denitrificans TaxID=179636 RepID=UPI00384CA040
MAMTASIHYENANFLRDLAENLPQVRPQGYSAAQVALLQRLADEELAQAQHDEWIRRKVASAKADTRPGLTTQEVRASLQSRFERLRDVPR